MELELQTGTFESTLDEKGRVVVPLYLRDYYKEKLVITQGIDRCVQIMTMPVYKGMLEVIEKLKEKLNHGQIKNIRYHLEAPARTAEIDPKTGRIPIPVSLRRYARLLKDCLVLSIDNHLEVWNKDDYDIFSGDNHSGVIEAINQLDGSVDFFGGGKR